MNMMNFLLLFCLSLAVAAKGTPQNNLTLYAPDDASLYYSPFAWQVTSQAASTVNSGSYIKFLCSGTVLNFHFDVSNMASPPSQIYWTVDNGPKTRSPVLDVVSVAIPNVFPYHTVELFIKSTTERAERWSATTGETRIILTNIETDGVLASWIPSDVNILIYGDSITEGVLTNGGNDGPNDTDHNDATMVYSHVLGPLLGAEVGVIGFGFSGLTHNGSGAVPPLGISWNQLWDGVPRSFSNPKPDLIILNEGTNDGCDVTTPGCVGTDIVADLTAVLKALVAECPNVPIAVLELFNGGQQAHLQAAVKAANSNGNIYYVATDNFYDLQFGGSLHPTGPNDVAKIAPQIASKLRPLLYQSVLNRYKRSEQEF